MLYYKSICISNFEIQGGGEEKGVVLQREGEQGEEEGKGDGGWGRRKRRGLI